MSDAEAMLKAAGYEAPEVKAHQEVKPTGGFVVEVNGGQRYTWHTLSQGVC